MYLPGEQAASDLSFNQQEQLNKLKLEQLEIQQKIQDGTATANDYNQLYTITTEEQQLDLQKQINDLQTSITYDPQKRQIQELLDPLNDQAMTEAQIVKQIKLAQEQQTSVNKEITLGNAALKDAQNQAWLLQRQFDLTNAAVTTLDQTITQMLNNFVSEYNKLAEESTNKAAGGSGVAGAGTIPTYQTGGWTVEGLAWVHGNELVLSPNAKQMVRLNFASLADTGTSAPTSATTIIQNFEKLELPNVTDGQSFIDQLRKVGLRQAVPR
jgi:hypothetical protein